VLQQALAERTRQVPREVLAALGQRAEVVRPAPAEATVRATVESVGRSGAARATEAAVLKPALGAPTAAPESVPVATAVDSSMAGRALRVLEETVARAPGAAADRVPAAAA